MARTELGKALEDLIAAVEHKTFDVVATVSEVFTRETVNAVKLLKHKILGSEPPPDDR